MAATNRHETRTDCPFCSCLLDETAPADYEVRVLVGNDEEGFELVDSFRVCPHCLQRARLASYADAVLPDDDPRVLLDAIASAVPDEPSDRVSCRICGALITDAEHDDNHGLCEICADD